MVTIKNSCRLFNIILLLSILTVGGCKTSKAPISTAAYHIPKTECIMLAANDKVLLEIWAKGLSKSQAIIAAKKKAVEEITFSGIHAGETSGVSYPLIDSPSAREKHAEFFNDFFADKGKFNDFVREADKSNTSLSQGDDFVLCRTRLIVDKGSLRDFYIKKKIIK